MTDIDDVREAVEAVQDKSVFNLVEAIKGRGYPTDEVTVFTDVEAGFELEDLERSMTTIAQSPEHGEHKEQFEELEKVAALLTEQIQDSAITFHLRGISPGHIKKIQRAERKAARELDLDEDEFQEILTAAYIAPHIIKTVDAKGAVEERIFTRDDVLALMEFLDVGEFNKLDRAVARLSFAASYFEAATDAGFLQKS